ncbi:Protein of unknown function DUF761, plant [Dillenia turbinata]|uniref:Uncharacterized protein n=1 Tax=Dillenia turbinata TaxID=194707 RepID=A0AAN8UKM1_9MAGN
MEEEEEQATTPFWLQSSNSLRRRDRRNGRRSPPSTLFLNSGSFVVFLIFTALFLIFFVIPSLRSFKAHVFKPQTVKKSWDSLNLVLVLFAIICGFLGRNNEDNNVSKNRIRNMNKSSDEEDDISNNLSQNRQKSDYLLNQTQWFSYSDHQLGNSSSFGVSSTTGLALRRNSSSYPDLRLEPPWVSGDNRRRFFDDTHMGNYRNMPSFSGSDHLHHIYKHGDVGEEKEEISDHVRIIREDISSITHLPPSTTGSESSPEVNERGKQIPTVYQTLPRKTDKIELEVKREKIKKSQPSPSLPPHTMISESSTANAPTLLRRDKTEMLVKREKQKKSQPPPPPPPPPSPPPTPPLPEKFESGPKSSKKRSKDFSTSFYQQTKKKKKQRQKSVENFEKLLSAFTPKTKSKTRPPPSPPPPPPPPPPPSVFHNLFSSKKSKTKKNSTDPLQQNSYPSKSSTTISQIAREPPLPQKSTAIVTETEDNLGIGNESPLIPIPPPPPPFKTPYWSFVVQGDYVRLKSFDNSRSNSPETVEGGDGADPPSTPPRTAHMQFCPSPDVDTKADTFIARFKAGLRLEKINSIKEKQDLGLEGAGPSPGPDPS